MNVYSFVSRCRVKLSVIDRDVSTAILLVFVRRWSRVIKCCYLCGTLVCCDWRISILVIIPVIRCFLSGPFGSCSAVVFSDCGHPSFRNFDSAIPIDIVRVKSYLNCLFHCVPVRIMINKLNLVPKRDVSRLVSVF